MRSMSNACERCENSCVVRCTMSSAWPCAILSAFSSDNVPPNGSDIAFDRVIFPTVRSTNDFGRFASPRAIASTSFCASAVMNGALSMMRSQYACRNSGDFDSTADGVPSSVCTARPRMPLAIWRRATSAL
jgi:hypothetical protein